MNTSSKWLREAYNLTKPSKEQKNKLEKRLKKWSNIK